MGFWEDINECIGYLLNYNLCYKRWIFGMELSKLKVVTIFPSVSKLLHESQFLSSPLTSGLYLCNSVGFNTLHWLIFT